MTSDSAAFPLEFIEAADPRYLRQGDVVADVPLIVPPARIIALETPVRTGASVQARVLERIGANKPAYMLAQVILTDAIILTYDCDLDGALYAIRNRRPADADDLVTVAAALEITDYHRDRLPEIMYGKMPRFAYLPASVSWPDRILDFTTIQQVDMRELLPRAVKRRICGLTAKGQLRLAETIGHALGDVYRRGRGDAAPGDPQLMRDAYNVLTSVDR